MNLGVCKLKLRCPGSHSLKDKRRIVKSITSRIQRKYNISVAEVDDQDLWQLATLGIACVSNHRQHADETLARVISFITENYPELEVVDCETEVLPAL